MQSPPASTTAAGFSHSATSGSFIASTFQPPVRARISSNAFSCQAMSRGVIPALNLRLERDTQRAQACYM
jgi:hypothetical protein